MRRAVGSQRLFGDDSAQDRDDAFHLARSRMPQPTVGAVNTVSDEDGKWVGDNTDVHGVEAALQSVGFNPQGKKVVIMGRGGGAKAAAAAVQGARIVRVLSRDEMSRSSRQSPAIC